MQLSAVITEKIKHKHSQKESNFPLPSLTSALPPCSRPLEFIQPLATRAEAWQAIPGVSEWVMGIIKRGYSLQFARRPPRFSGVVSTSVQGENARVLRSEVMTLLEKGAIEMVSPALSESGFYSRYFLVPKKDGGLRPILDLRRLNHALMRRPFRMITLKQILSQIRTEDWFCSLDLKDAYFHIQIAPHHRRFLRFAFEGVAYQYTVLPFGLSLAPRTFTKCMDAALSPLRQMGIRILNYLDDWLILAQSEVELLSHRTLILSHLERLGLRVNFAKSALSPSQRISFLGTVLDTAHMRAVIAPERALAIQKLAATFKSDTARPLKVFQRMLGLMAAASPVLQLGLLRMRPLQRWLKPRVPHNAWRHGRLHIRVNQACVTALTPWKNPRWMEKGVAMGLVHTRKVVTTDASNTGWGALCEGKQTFEPLQSTDLRSLSLKTALLLALASFKRVGDLQALSTSPACLEFGPNDSKFVLKPRHGYVPKVLSTPFRAQVITLSALPPSEEDRELSLLCPVRALRIYFERSAPFRHTEQLFVSFGNRTKGHPVTKQRLSKWIVDAVILFFGPAMPHWSTSPFD